MPGTAVWRQATAAVREPPAGRRVQVKALRYSDPGRNSVASFTRPVSFDELATVQFEYDMRVRDALLIDAKLIRVQTEKDLGLLTPAGMRLSLGRKVLDHSEIVPPEKLGIEGGGASWDQNPTRDRRPGG